MTDTKQTKTIPVPQSKLDAIWKLKTQLHTKLAALQTVHQKLDKHLEREKVAVHELDTCEEDLHELLNGIVGYEPPDVTKEAKEKDDEEES